MANRARVYDSPGGERSMAATVEAFRALTRDAKLDTEERGWLFMELLKAARSQQGAYRADNYVDGAAYAGLAGEAAARDRDRGRARTGCQAVQHSNQIVCQPCGLTWDVNDPEPPQCPRHEETNHEAE